MSKFVIYSKTDCQVWSILDQYIIEEDGTIAGGYNGVNTVRYHISTNPAVLEISEDLYKTLNVNNLDKYIVVNGIISEKPDDENYIPGNSVLEDKIIRLDIDCTNTIYNGTDITLSDGNTYHFTLTDKDQLNLSGIGLELIMGAETIAWHEDDETVPCRFYSASDATKIISTLTAWKEYHITYFRDLRIYINSLTDENMINNISYGDNIPEEFKSEVLKSYEEKLSNMDGD